MPVERPLSGTVTDVRECDLRVESRPWAWAIANGASIDGHWEKAQRANPKYFNGTIFLIDDFAIRNGAAAASFIKTDFKSYLFWRSRGWPEAGVLDGFGSALLRSCEGHVVLGQQKAGHVNGGLAYFPGGFIDTRDISGDGRVDIDSSIARELEEETGLTARDLVRTPGYLVTRFGPHVSFAVAYRSASSSDELTAAINARIIADPHSELAKVVAIAVEEDMAAHQVAPYARCLINALFDTPSFLTS